MQTTTKLYSGFAATRARLAMLAVTLMVGMVGFMTPAWASLQNPLTVSAQSGTPTAGTVGSASYTVTVNRTLGAPATPTMTVTGLPAGATYLFGAPSLWTPATGTGSRTYPLTINTSAATPVGTTTFVAHAAAVGSTTRNGFGTLLIAPANQTITFGALSLKTFGDADFSVSATATSALPVSFAAAGNCSVTGALVHLTGSGSCTITASQAGDANYAAATPVPQTFAILQPSAPIAQTITFNTLADKFVGDAAFAVSATSTSGLAVSFTAAGDCTVAGSTVTLVTPAIPTNTCTITASQAGNVDFSPAVDVLRTFAISTFTGADLHAVAGTAALPGHSVTVWGYYSATGDPAIQKPGGAPIIVNQGDSVAIRLYNELTEPTALLFQGQAMVPDTTGVAPGGSKVYTFTASQPGTFLYEAGLLHNAEHQVAMGLHGALIVRPAGLASQAYTDATTAFNNEAVLVLSEIDPALNNIATLQPSKTPADFDMREFAPSYFLINGQVYPNTVAIPTVPGNKVLLRYVNAGVQHHSMAVLGLRQNFVAKDAGVVPTLTHNVAAETLAPGQTGDAIATVPLTAADGSRFAVYDGSLKLYN
ncbi:MAG: multicopper oxidase domain-containing protein, partial [Steroidobacteraceae bacterium]